MRQEKEKTSYIRAVGKEKRPEKKREKKKKEKKRIKKTYRGS